METYSNSLCRICFESGDFSVNDYEVNIQGNNISIDKMIKRFSDTEFTDENAPEMICENCTHDLVQSYLFVGKILEADAVILNRANFTIQDLGAVNEDELQLPKDEYEEIVCQSTEDSYIEDKIVRNEEEPDDLIEECVDANSVEEMYIESEFSADDYENIVSPGEPEFEIKIDRTETLSNIYANYELQEEDKEIEPEPEEPRKKYQRKNKTSNEVDKNGSFVITQFASSIVAPRIQSNTTEDTDEVTLSDVRIMNYETVEVKAGNINVVNQAHHSELPIDDSRIYLCQYCPRAFSTSAFLISHVRKTHGCKFCASVFEKAKDLYSHIREAHSKFECVVCSKQFVSNSNMRNHLKTVHKVKVPANVSLISYKKQSDLEEEC